METTQAGGLAVDTVPLCVDLDGTLLKTDSLYEQTLHVLRVKPWLMLWLPFWLLKGKHHLKRELSAHHTLDVGKLPFNADLLAFLKEQKAAGRKLVLVTGCYQGMAEKIAEHFGLFDEVHGTNEHHNLTGRNKANLLTTLFGRGQFDYAGNSTVDIPVWQAARHCYLVNATAKLQLRLQQTCRFERILDTAPPAFPQILKSIRLYQWAKNGLIFVPLMAAHKMNDPVMVFAAFAAFVAFSFAASLAYIINDLSDLDADRRHHQKKHRPFAAATLPLSTGIKTAAMLFTGSLLIALQLPERFQLALLAYFVITNLYTIKFKYIPIMDVTVLAGLYTLRVIAGAYGISTDLSFWLLGFSSFLFFSLALVKRVSELLNLLNGVNARSDADHPVKELKTRGYSTLDLPILQSLGTSSAMLSVLVLAFYVNNPSTRLLYESPRHLWLLCPVILLWIGRVWLITGRGQMNEDPVIFTLKDRVSWLIMALAIAIMISGTFF